jgi:hypothetical protein
MAMSDEDPDLALAGLVGDHVVVLHGRRGDELEPGRDVDCLVEGLDPRWALRLTGGWRLCQWHRYDLRAWYWVLERDGEFVALDTTDDPGGFGRDAVRTRSILSEMDGESPEFTHVAYLTVKRVRKGTLDPTEWARIGKVASRDPVAFAATLERLAGPELASVLSPIAVAGVAPEPAVVRSANRLRWMRRFGSATRTIRALSMGARRYAERIVSPSGLSVLVVGPDGVGKSTLAASLSETCAPMFRRHSHSHWRPGVLPRPGAVLGRAPSDPTRPHARAAFGWLPSALLLGYYWFDFLAGALLSDMPLKTRSGLVVRERGWWDLAVDPGRYRLRVDPLAVRILGALLPRPDLVIVLEGDPDVLRDRKPELERPEVERQLIAWRSASPDGVPTIRIDVSKPAADVLRAATDAVVRVMESRAVSRLGAGWVRLPGGRVRWWLPRGSRGVARTAVSVYQPVTGRALAGWAIARSLAITGGFRLLPRGSAPPPSVRRRLAPHLSPRGTIAVGRATHPGRYVVLLLDEHGTCEAVAKIATDPSEARVIEQEAVSIGRFADRLPDSVRAPRVLHAEPGLLLLEPFEWVPRRRPWELEEPVARALGQLFRSGKREPEAGWTGPAHGDAAPWNLLRTPRGWALVDWESAGEAPAFHDVCHYIVQSHALLGRPSASSIIEGFCRGRGWVGRAVSAYAEAADIPSGSAREALAGYLERAIRDVTCRTRAEWKGAQRRRRLLDRLGGG